MHEQLQALIANSRVIYRSPEQVAWDTVAPHIPTPPATCGVCRYRRNCECDLIPASYDPQVKRRGDSDTCAVQEGYAHVMHLLMQTDPDAAMEEGLKRLGERAC